VGVIVVALLIGMLLAFAVSGLISRALKRGVDVANKLAQGDLSVSIGETGKDETGQLLAAMQTMIESIKGLAADSIMLSRAAIEGKLATRADATKHQGAFREVVEGVNGTLDAVIGPLNVAAEYVDRISKGDMPAQIKEEYRGDFNAIKDNLNVLIRATDTITAAAKEVAGGDLTVKLEARSPGDELMQSLSAQPPRAQRSHRGGAGGRARQGVRRGGKRGEKAGGALPEGSRGDLGALLIERRGRRKGGGYALQDASGHPAYRGAGAGDLRRLQGAGYRRRADQQGDPATGPGDPAERLGGRGDVGDGGGTAPQSSQLQDTIGFFYVGETNSAQNGAKRPNKVATHPAVKKAAFAKAPSRLTHAGTSGTAIELHTTDEAFESY
jgi:HAMP domain-containing protein